MSADETVTRILGDWRARLDRGERVEPEQVIASHPEFAGELRARFLALEMANRFFATEAVGAGGPERLGDYRIVREVARGGMAVVYEAEQISMGRRVALKVLHPSITTTAKTVERFRREAKVTGLLKHTNIVAVYQMGEEKGLLYYAMELVEGRSLAAVVADLRREEGRPAEEDLVRAAAGRPSRRARHASGSQATTRDRAYFVRAAEMFAQVAEALHAAHAHGVVHRDLKPSNLLLDRSGTLKVTDFGLARLLLEGGDMTVTGELLGTPLYMSPEQARGARDVDHRTDIYSLGATLYEVLTLHRPFHGTDLADLARQILTKDPVPPRRWNRRIPRDLETIVLKALEKEPARRYRTAEEMAADLRHFTQGAAIRARRLGPAARAWRRIVRRPVLSALAGGLVAAMATLSWLWIERGAEQARLTVAEGRRVELEYAQLCILAERAAVVASGVRFGVSGGHPEPAHEGAAAHEALFERAMKLAPGRPEAYLSRALLPDREPQERLVDIEAAARRGAPPRVVHLARAWVHSLARRGEDEERERLLAAAFPVADPAGDYLEGVLAAQRGDRDGALARFEHAIAGSPVGSALHYLARWSRSVLKEEARDFEAALGDLLVLEAAGGAPSAVLDVRIASLWRRLGRADRARAVFEAALRRADSPEAWLDLCGACEPCREYPWMEEAAKAALSVCPGHEAPLHLFLAKACKGSGRLEEALDWCDAAIASDPESHHPQEARGIALLDLRRWEEAAGASRRAIALEPECAAVRIHLSVALQRLGEVDEAIGSAREAIRLDADLPEAWNTLANALNTKGDPKAALDACDRALLLRPRFPDALVTRSSALVALGDFAGALEAVGAAIALEPERGEWHCNRGWILEEAERYEEALRAYDEAIRLGGPESEARRAGVLLALEKYELALESSEKALAIDPRNAKALSNKALILHGLGRSDEAVAAIEAAIAADPSWLPGYFNRTSILNDMGRWSDLLRAADEALAMGGWTREYSADLHERKGIALGASGDAEGAAECFRQAIGEGLATPEVFRRLAIALRQGGRPREALEVLDQALAGGAESVGLHEVRAVVLSGEGRPEDALRSCDRALALDPEAGFALLCRADALHDLGREDEAIAASEEAVRRTDDPRARGLLAWVLATSAKPERRGVERALHLARKAAGAMPDSASARLSLGAALYRAAEWEDAAKEIRHSMDLDGGGDASQWFFLAMAEWQLGRRESARGSFAKAVEWTGRERPKDVVLERLRAEAEALLAGR